VTEEEDAKNQKINKIKNFKSARRGPHAETLDRFRVTNVAAMAHSGSADPPPIPTLLYVNELG
jgi:hypothetical protein